MYTVQEAFNQSIAIIDELSETGTVDANKTKEYSNKAPYLADLWQREMVASGGLVRLKEYANIDDTAVKKWTKVTYPTDFRSILEIVFINADSQFSTVNYRQFGNSELYIYFEDVGTAKMLYTPTTIKLTLLTQAIEVDDLISASLPYYLAEHFALSDQNDTLASVCRAKYNMLRNQTIIKYPIALTDIKDVYGV